MFFVHPIKVLGSFAGFAATVVALGFGFAVQAAEFELKFNTPDRPENISGVGMQAFKQCVESRSNDRVEVQLFFSGALGKPRDNLESLQLGTLDMSVIQSAITTVDKTLGVLQLPYIFRDRNHVDTVMNGAVGEWIAERLLKKGLRVLGVWEGGFRHITNNVRPIFRPEDLKGIKMRTPSSEVRVKIFNTYGADASALPWAELYTALQMGVYDGQENPAEVVEANKFFEVQKYLSFTGHVYSAQYALISEAIYSKLPWEIQVLLRQCGGEAGPATVESGINMDKRVTDFAKSKGMQVNHAEIDAFVAVSRPIWGDLSRELGPEAEMLIELIASAGK